MAKSGRFLRGDQKPIKARSGKTPSGVCPRCQGSGLIKEAGQPAYMDSPIPYYDVICPDCEGNGTTI